MGVLSVVEDERSRKSPDFKVGEDEGMHTVEIGGG